MLRVPTPLSNDEEAMVSRCLDCGLAVHRALGPGFKELIYHRAFTLEADSRGLRLESEKSIEVKYRQWSISGQRVDLIVEGIVLVEIKAVPKLRLLHERQVMSYLKTMDLKVGLLLNFNTTLLKHGMKRVTRFAARS
jgi:GxxExxY protein